MSLSTTGRYEITEEVFNTVKHIFNKIADNLLLKKNKRISSILIILSQTFYIMKDFNKYYLQKEIKNHKFFRTVEFWQEHINNSILEEIDRFEKGLIKNDISFSKEKKKKKVDDIIFTKMISLIASFNGFEMINIQYLFRTETDKPEFRRGCTVAVSKGIWKRT